MGRVVFVWFGRPIHSYPVMLYVGIVLGVEVQLYAARSIGVDVIAALAATLTLLTTALLGARLLHAATNWPTYRRDPRRILQFSTGGASMYGGLLLAVPLSVPLLAALGIPFGTFWDLASFTMLVGMIVTRIGCFLNGCCAGRPTSGWWGIDLQDYRGTWQRRIPAQALEALWGCLVLAGAALLWRRLSFDGALFLYALGGYGAGRVWLESTRDEQDRVMGMRVHRVISTGFVAIAVGAFATSWLR